MNIKNPLNLPILFTILYDSYKKKKVTRTYDSN